MQSANHALVSNLITAWNERDLEALLACYSDSCGGADLARGRHLHTRADIRATFLTYWQAFPDLQISPGDLIDDGERVALFWTGQGTHRGAIFNIPATGRHVEFQGVSRLKIVDGRVVDMVLFWDMAGLLRALGLLPDL